MWLCVSQFREEGLGWGPSLASTSTAVMLVKHHAALAFDLCSVWNRFEHTS